MSVDTNFLDLVKIIRGRNILVVGDIMLDRFVYGAAERISPESPVPVLQISREETMLGGAGNTLANLHGLEAKGHILSVIGDDEAGETLSALAHDKGIDVKGLLIDRSRPTTLKTRYLASHQQLLRTDFEKKTPISDSLLAQLKEHADIIIQDMQAVVLSDYGKGLLHADLIRHILKAAKHHDLPVIVDPKGTNFSRYAGATAITPNKKELAEATNMPVQTDQDVEDAARALIKTCDVDNVVVTRSQDGMSVISRDDDPVHIPTSSNIDVFDVSGAGDAVVAVIAASLASGGDIKTAATLANIAGAIVVSKVGTAPIRARDLMDALEDGTQNLKLPSSKTQGHEAPIADWHDAHEQVQRWRARGRKIGFTNGCFDILHAGHVSYLNEARRHCDRLIVGINRDESVSILKGPERPIHNEDNRAAVLAALGAVDMVVVFGAQEEGQDNTVSELLSLLKPDVYFKGGDYTRDQIPEAPTVESYGGEIAIMRERTGHSTTGILKKLEDEAA